MLAAVMNTRHIVRLAVLVGALAIPGLASDIADADQPPSYEQAVLVPSILVVLILAGYWLGVIWLARRYRTRIDWRRLRRWLPLVMSALMLPLPLLCDNHSSALLRRTAETFAAVVVVLNLPVLAVDGVLNWTFRFDVTGLGGATLLFGGNWLGWYCVLRVIESRIEAHEIIALGL
jgi:hypothetical protein